MSLFSYFIRYQVHTDIICIGGILLLIRRMTATFGKLQGNTLELSPGLNILERDRQIHLVRLFAVDALWH